MKILVLNAGSSSIKYQVYQMPESEVIAKGSIDHIGEEPNGDKNRVEDHEHGIEIILDTLAESYYVNGMVDEAIEAAEKALQLAKRDRGYFERQLQKYKMRMNYRN